MDICHVSGQEFCTKIMKKLEFLTEYNDIIKEVKLNKLTFTFLLRNKTINSITKKIKISGNKEIIKRNSLLRSFVGLISNLFDRTLENKDVTFNQKLPDEIQTIFLEALNKLPYEIKNHFLDLTNLLEKNQVQIETHQQFEFNKRQKLGFNKKYHITLIRTLNNKKLLRTYVTRIVFDYIYDKKYQEKHKKKEIEKKEKERLANAQLLKEFQEEEKKKEKKGKNTGMFFSIFLCFGLPYLLKSEVKFLLVELESIKEKYIKKGIIDFKTLNPETMDCFFRLISYRFFKKFSPKNHKDFFSSFLEKMYQDIVDKKKRQKEEVLLTKKLLKRKKTKDELLDVVRFAVMMGKKNQRKTYLRVGLTAALQREWVALFKREMLEYLGIFEDRKEYKYFNTFDGDDFVSFHAISEEKKRLFFVYAYQLQLNSCVKDFQRKLQGQQNAIVFIKTLFLQQNEILNFYIEEFNKVFANKIDFNETFLLDYIRRFELLLQNTLDEYYLYYDSIEIKSLKEVKIKKTYAELITYTIVEEDTRTEEQKKIDEENKKIKEELIIKQNKINLLVKKNIAKNIQQLRDFIYFIQLLMYSFYRAKTINDFTFFNDFKYLHEFRDLFYISDNSEARQDDLFDYVLLGKKREDFSIKTEQLKNDQVLDNLGNKLQAKREMPFVPNLLINYILATFNYNLLKVANIEFTSETPPNNISFLKNKVKKTNIKKSKKKHKVLQEDKQINRKLFYRRAYGLDLYSYDNKRITKDLVIKHFLLVKKNKKKILNKKLQKKIKIYTRIKTLNKNIIKIKKKRKKKLKRKIRYKRYKYKAKKIKAFFRDGIKNNYKLFQKQHIQYNGYTNLRDRKFYNYYLTKHISRKQKFLFIKISLRKKLQKIFDFLKKIKYLKKKIKLKTKKEKKKIKLFIKKLKSFILRNINIINNLCKINTLIKKPNFFIINQHKYLCTSKQTLQLIKKNKKLTNLIKINGTNEIKINEIKSILNFAPEKTKVFNQYLIYNEPLKDFKTPNNSLKTQKVLIDAIDNRIQSTLVVTKWRDHFTSKYPETRPFEEDTNNLEAHAAYNKFLKTLGFVSNKEHLNNSDKQISFLDFIIKLKINVNSFKLPKKMIEIISISSLTENQLDEEGDPVGERQRTVSENTDRFEQEMRAKILSSPKVATQLNDLELEDELLLLPYSITQILPKLYLWIKHKLILEILHLSYKTKYLKNLVFMPNNKPEDLETDCFKEFPRKTIIKTYITSSLSDEYPLLLAKRFISETYTHVYSEEEPYFNGRRELEFFGERGVFAFNLIKVRIANWLQYIQEDTCTWIKPEIGGQSEYYFIVVKDEKINTKLWPIYKNKDMEDLLELFDSYEYLNLNNPLIAKFRIGNPIFYHEGGESEIVSRHKLTGRRKHMVVRRGFNMLEPYQEADTHFNEVDIADSEVYPEHSEIFLKKEWHLETDTTIRTRKHSSEISRIVLTYKPKSSADLYAMLYDSIQDKKAIERQDEFQGKVLRFLLGQNFPQKVRDFILSVKNLIFSSVVYKKLIKFMLFFKQLFKNFKELFKIFLKIYINFYEILPISLQNYLYQIYNKYYKKNIKHINTKIIIPLKDLIKYIGNIFIKMKHSFEALIYEALRVLYKFKNTIYSSKSLKKKHISRNLFNQTTTTKNKIIQNFIQKHIVNVIKAILIYIFNHIKEIFNNILKFLKPYSEIIQKKCLILVSKRFPLLYEDFKIAYKDNEGVFLDIGLKFKAFFRGMYMFFKDFSKDIVTPFFKAIDYYKVTIQIYLKHVYKTKRVFKRYRYYLGNVKTFLKASKRIFFAAVTDKRFYLNLPLTSSQIFYYVFILPILNLIYKVVIVAYKKQVINIITHIQRKILQNFDKRYNSQLTYLDVINQKRFTYKEFFLNSMRYHDKAINPDTFTRSLHIQYLHNDKILWTQESQYNIYNYFSYHALLTKMHTYLFESVCYLIYAHLFFFLIFDLILQEKSIVINTLVFATEPFIANDDLVKPSVKYYKFEHGGIAHVRGVHAKKTNYSLFELYTEKDKAIMPMSHLPIRNLLYYKTVFQDLFKEFKKIGTKYYKKHIRYFIKYFQINKYLKIIFNYITPPTKFCIKIYFYLKKFFFQFNEVYIEPLYIYIYTPLIRNPIINIYKLCFNTFNIILKVLNEILYSYFYFFYEKFILIFHLIVTLLKLPFNFYWYELLIKPWNDLFFFVKNILFEPIFSLIYLVAYNVFTQITLFFTILTFILLSSLWTYFITDLIFITTTHKRIRKVFELLAEQRRSLSTGFNFRFLLNDDVHISPQRAKIMNLLRERMYYIDDEEEERFFFVYLFNKHKCKYEKIKLYTDFDYYDYNLTLRNNAEMLVPAAAMMVPAVKYPSKEYFKNYALTKNSNFTNLKVLKFHPKSVIIHPKMILAVQRQAVNPILTQFIRDWDNKYNSDFYGARTTYKEYVDKDFREMFGYRDQLWHYLYLYLKASNQQNYKVLRRLRVHFYNNLQIERSYLTVFKQQELFYRYLNPTSRSILPSFVEDKSTYKVINHGILSPIYPTRGFKLLKRFKHFTDHNSLHVIEPFELPKALASFGISNYFYEHDIPERAYTFVIPFTDITIDLDDQNDDDELDIDNDDTEVCEEPNYIAAGVDDPIEEPDDDLIDESDLSEYFELNENIWWAYYTCQQDLELELFIGRPDVMRVRVEFEDEDDFDDPENSEETTKLGNEFSFNDQPPYFASFFSWIKASLILVLFFDFITDLVRVYKIDRTKQVDPYKIIFIMLLIVFLLLIFGRIFVR